MTRNANYRFSDQVLRLAAAGSLPTSTGNRDFAGQSKLMVDFSHGDVGAFTPFPRAITTAVETFADKHSAYSPYRGHGVVREVVAANLGLFLGSPVDPDTQVIITAGTQGGLYLALSALVGNGDQVAIVNPDYFADARIVEFLGATPRYVALDYLNGSGELDLDELKAALSEGARVVCLSNPNNPTGITYGPAQLEAIAELCERWDAFLISDELYSRLHFGESPLAHAWSIPALRERSVSLLGPSKTESLSGFRVGVAVGAPKVIDAMERIQSIVSLRAAGYAQPVLTTWLREDADWLQNRIDAHRRIRDAIVLRWRAVPGLQIQVPSAGSYLFPSLPPTLTITTSELLAGFSQELGIIATNGAEFGPGGDHSFRINFSQDPEIAISAAELMADFIRSKTA